MKQREPFPFQPMRVRGVLGVTSRIYFGNFGALCAYSFLLFGIFFIAISAVSYFSMSSMMNSASVFGAIPQLDAMSPLDAFSSPQMSRTIHQMTNMISMMVGLQLINVVISILLTPLFEGGAAMGARRAFSGEKIRFKTLMKDGGGLYGKSVVTALSLIVYGLCLLVVMTLLMIPFSFLFALMIIPAAASQNVTMLILGCVIFFILLLFVIMIMQTFILLVYPVVANERVAHFRAIGRSFQLVCRKFWKTLFTQLIPMLVLAGISILLCIPFGILAATAGSASIPAVTVFALLIPTLLLVLLYLPYQTTLQSVLYFDLRAREIARGDQTRKPADPQQQLPQPSYPPQPVPPPQIPPQPYPPQIPPQPYPPQPYPPQPYPPQPYPPQQVPPQPFPPQPPPQQP